jgi:hypothetical protein
LVLEMGMGRGMGRALVRALVMGVQEERGCVHLKTSPQTQTP